MSVSAPNWEVILAAQHPATGWAERFRPRVREARRGGAVGVATLADWCQETAARHAASFGMGLDDPLPERAAWVLAKLRLAVLRYPRLGERAVVETWPSGLQRHSAGRAFRVTTEAGELLAAAESRWSLLDLDRRRPLGRVAAVFDRVPPPGPRLLAVSQSIRSVSAEPDVATEIAARPAEIDVYGHVNNAHLVGWIAGGAASLVDDPFAPCDLEIAFRSECRRRDRFVLRAAREGSDGICAALVRAGQAIDAVRARLDYGAETVAV